jgi:hypothetical protein
MWRQSPVQSGQIKRSGFAVVSGRVSKIERNRGGIWIELQGALVLRIAPDLPANSTRPCSKAARACNRGARLGAGSFAARWLEKPQARWLLPLTDPAC